MTTINRSPAPAPTLQPTATTTAAKTTSSTSSTSTDQRNAALNDATYQQMMGNFQLGNLKGTNTDTSGKNKVDASYWFKQGDIDELAKPYIAQLDALKAKQPPLDPATFQKQAQAIVDNFKGGGDGKNPGLQTQQGFISIFLNNLFMRMNQMYTKILTSFGGG
jgi:hypothetical protein